VTKEVEIRNLITIFPHRRVWTFAMYYMN